MPKNVSASTDNAPRPMFPTSVPKALRCDIRTFADLFCGIGGFHFAAASLGLKCVFASDNNEPAAAQYAHTFGLRPAADIKTVASEDIPAHDLLFAGFPCQPFSIIGLRGGLADMRGELFREIVRVLRAKRPAAFVLENVKQLTTHGGGETLRVILEELNRAGYDCDWRVLNALDYGLPQKRERVIIVGMRCGLERFEWPQEEPAYRPLGEILEKRPHKRHCVSERIRQSRAAKHKSKHRPGIWHENKGGNISSYPYSCALRANASYNYLLVNGVRRLTPREMLRLQGFPDSLDIIGSDSQVRQQAGNAVPVPIVEAVIREVLRARSKNAGQSAKLRKQAISA